LQFIARRQFDPVNERGYDGRDGDQKLCSTWKLIIFNHHPAYSAFVVAIHAASMGRGDTTPTLTIRWYLSDLLYKASQSHPTSLNPLFSHTAFISAKHIITHDLTDARFHHHHTSSHFISSPNIHIMFINFTHIINIFIQRQQGL